MEVRRAASVGEFLALAGDFLVAREAEHNLIFGICSSIEADPTQYDGPPYLAAVVRDGEVVGAALRTPPWRLALSLMDDTAAVERLADDLAGEPLPGVVGPAESAATFAAAWTERTGVPSRLGTNERAFQVRHVIQPRPAPGHMILARPSDRALVVEWLQAFQDEALAGDPREDWERVADRWLKGIGRTLYLWVDGDRVVSLTGSGGRTPNSARIGPVYTPPELRGRGYASNLVAAATQALLDDGRAFVTLFTDLANATSNKVYQAIGYEPVIDVDEYVFG